MTWFCANDCGHTFPRQVDKGTVCLTCTALAEAEQHWRDAEDERAENAALTAELAKVRKELDEARLLADCREPFPWEPDGADERKFVSISSTEHEVCLVRYTPCPFLGDRYTIGAFIDGKFHSLNRELDLSLAARSHLEKTIDRFEVPNEGDLAHGRAFAIADPIGINSDPYAWVEMLVRAVTGPADPLVDPESID